MNAVWRAAAGLVEAVANEARTRLAAVINPEPDEEATGVADNPHGEPAASDNATLVQIVLGQHQVSVQSNRDDLDEAVAKARALWAEIHGPHVRTAGGNPSGFASTEWAGPADICTDVALPNPWRGCQ